MAICGSGVGASVCTNKIPGVRAGLVHDHFSARQGVEDDHMNVICIGDRTVGPSIAWHLVETSLGALFSHAERRLRRLGKVGSLGGAGDQQPTQRPSQNSLACGLALTATAARSRGVSNSCRRRAPIERTSRSTRRKQ